MQLEWELEVCEKESGELQEYANSVLQQIADYCPDILEQVVNALEESCWPSQADTQALGRWQLSTTGPWKHDIKRGSSTHTEPFFPLQTRK